MMVSRHMLRASGAHRSRLVILGSGWGAYRVLKNIDCTKYKCVVVSPRNHFLFTPLLSSAAVGTTALKSICQPVRPLCAKKNTKFYEAIAQSVDKIHKTVQCETPDGQSFDLPYDKLVISVGFQANDFGIPEVAKYAHFLKDTADAAILHEHVLRKFETASTLHLLDGDERLSPEEEKKLRSSLSFVIVGAGPTGVELCGELSDFIRDDIFHMYSHLKDYIQVHLVDAQSVVLGPFQDEALQTYARKHLERKMQVNIHLSEFVSNITVDSISFKSGKTIDFGTLVWCAGIKPYPFTKALEVAKSKNGAQILVDGNLRVKNEESIFAIGDCSTIENYWLPQTAQVAKQQAGYLAKNLNSNVDTSQWKPFSYFSLGVMANLGARTAVMKSPFVRRVTGFLGFLSWRGAYWSQQLSMRNRFLLACDWVGTTLFGRDLMRKGLGTKAQALDDRK
eukprot:GEMP01011434.1.p1 GENE.GEMP01011434.1~~GEMP01011434.1.p1  ORF type:complete len:450 (-),score=87.89 GEMP01011434.1:1805-3154(-)